MCREQPLTIAVQYDQSVLLSKRSVYSIAIGGSVAHSLGASRVLLHSISEAAATEVSSKCRELCPLVASRALVIGVGHSFYLI